jgi:DNA replication and repair protein RecF
MILKKIEVQNFRNIKHAELEFSSGVNIFCGDNAQGKTNLLEAIAICLGRSFRIIKRGDIIPFNNTNGLTKISLFYETEMIPDKINEIVYETDGNRYSVKINGIGLKKATDLYGEFRYVVFTPDNLNLIKGEPALRRSYLDNIAIMQNKSHRKFLSEYNYTLKQRTFTNHDRMKYSPDMIEVWDDLLAKKGINLTYGRLKYLELIREHACDIYRGLSGGEIFEIVYKSSIFTDGLDFGSDFESLDSENKQRLYNIYRVRLSACSCNSYSFDVQGAHRDDVYFTVNGSNAKMFASQGQLRSIAVSLKLAEAEIIRSFNRENPVVLLDEVLSELDEHRREFVLTHFVDSQCFITSCNVHDFEKMPVFKAWSVSNGIFTSRERCGCS